MVSSPLSGDEFQKELVMYEKRDNVSVLEVVGQLLEHPVAFAVHLVSDAGCAEARSFQSAVP